MSTYLFNFLAVRNGGTINYGRGFISAATRDPLNKFIVLLGADQSNLAIKADNIHYIYLRGMESAFTRFVVEQFIVPCSTMWFRCSAVFNPFDVCQLLKPVPVLLGMKNPSLLLNARGYYKGLSLKVRIYHKFRDYISYLSSEYADAVIFPTEYFKDHFLKISGARIENPHIVYHGCVPLPANEDINASRHRNSEDEFLIITVSVLYRYKNIHIIIEALNYLSRTVKCNIKLKIAGKVSDVGYFNELTHQVNEYGLQNNVEFLNFIDQRELIKLYKNADVFVFASDMETFGFPMVEALCIGCPLIVNNTQFAREICGDTALYYDLNDPFCLALVIEDVILKKSKPIPIEKAVFRGRMYSFQREFNETLKCLKAIH